MKNLLSVQSSVSGKTEVDSMCSVLMELNAVAGDWSGQFITIGVTPNPSKQRRTCPCESLWRRFVIQFSKEAVTLEPSRRTHSSPPHTAPFGEAVKESYGWWEKELPELQDCE